MRLSGLGVPELLLIPAIVTVLFGSSRLAGLGKERGQGTREFRRAMHEHGDGTPPSPDIVDPQ